MIKPNKLELGDTIGVVAPSSPIIEKNIDELYRAKEIVEKTGFKVKFAKNILSNTNKYSATAKEKADDINNMFKDKEIKMIWCAKGGQNSNSVFEYLDYEAIKNNPKIICGYSDITSITNIISEKANLVTFSSTNFKTIATDETNYSYNQAIKRFVDGNLELETMDEDKYISIQEGIGEGKLVGGNLSLIRGLVSGKYSINFENKILFIEELGFETNPELVSNYIYYLKQNDVFKKIKGLWIGNYTHESKISLEQVVNDAIKDENYSFPIIKSNNFGHIENKIVVPIGITAKIDTSKKIKIELLEECLK